MTKKLLFLGWLVLATEGASLYAQPRVQVDTFGIHEGLSDRFVRTIFRDRQGFLWIGTRNGLNRFDGRSFYVYNSQRTAPYHLHSEDIVVLAQTRGGKLLVGYYSKTDGFDLLDPSTGVVQEIALPPQLSIVKFLPSRSGGLSLIAKETGGYSLWQMDATETSMRRLIPLPGYFLNSAALADATGNSWIAEMTPEGSIVVNRYSPEGKKMTALQVLRFSPALTRDDAVGEFFEAANGTIWSMTGRSGLYVFNTQNQLFVRDTSFKPPYDFFKLYEDLQGNLLVQTAQKTGQTTGLILLERDGKRTDLGYLLKFSPRNSTFYSDDFTAGMIAGAGDGLKWLSYTPPMVRTYLTNINPAVAYGASIRGICDDGKGNILVSTERRGWYALSPQTGLTRQLRQGSELSLGRNLLKAADGTVWGVDNDLVQYFPQTGQFKEWPLPWKPESFVISQSGMLWLGFKDHLGVLNPQNGHFEEWRDAKGTRPVEGNTANYVLESKNGNIWVGSEKGLLLIQPKTRIFRVFNGQHGLTSAKITCLVESPEGLLWVGTLGGGLNLFDPQKGRVEAVFGVENGLANASIAGILPDQRGNYWISTYSGLSFFNPQEKTFRSFYQQDGFSHDEFNRFSFFREPASGTLYFGTIQGLNVLHPEDLLKAQPVAPILLSGLSYFDEAGKSRITVSHFKLSVINDMLVAPPVVLPPNNRFLQLKFAQADFRSFGRNQYACRIDGVDRQWNTIGTTGEMTLNYLPTGQYRLHIRGADRYGNWGAQELIIPINVLAPWYFRWWAWLIWGSMAFALVLGIDRFRKKRRQWQQEFEAEQREASRLKELNAFKNRLYANITHEFRTPLTIMLGIARNLGKKSPEPLEKPSEEATLKTQLKLMEQNGQHLLNLVNQMLELAKAENNSLKVKFVQGNVLPFLHFVAESFSSLANQQNVLLKVESREPEIWMDYAPECLRQILSNLLSNALRYTPSGGMIKVEIAIDNPLRNAEVQPCLLVKVSDTGPGISFEDLPKIFDRFYQAAAPETVQREAGSGIGLALVKELVHLLHGTIEAESPASGGAVFSLLLPITREALPEMVPVAPEVPLSSQKPSISAPLPSLLIVEDNADVVQYLRICLEPGFQLKFAYNGQAGLEQAFEQVPDLILSDVVMPGMDGFELCQALKNDPRSSHIPVVLLTAKGDMESRITGLRQGADAYLVKPFHQEELLATLDNLIRLREQLQKRYQASAIGEHPPPVAAELSPEEAFLQRVRAAVESELGNPDLTPYDICRKTGMGHTNLNLKLNALTGLPISLFIRKMRLQKAKTLLLSGKLTVSEIAYQTGFNDPKYFSRVFAEEYGAPPSAFKQPG